MAKKNFDLDIPRLCLAMQHSRLRLRYNRAERLEMVRQYIGKHCFEEASAERVPVNLISMYVNIVGRNLVAKNPRVMLSTFLKEHQPTVNAMESWANGAIEQMRLANTLQRVVIDALFSVGICKVALATPADAASYAWSLRAGQPFAARVDLDDFVYDIHARDFEEVAYIGHRFRVPLSSIRDSQLYDNSRKELSASLDPLFNLEGDERINVLGRGMYGDMQEFEDMVDLWEVYLPRHKLVITIADDHLTGPAVGTGAKPLRVQRWIGPDTGPYHILGMMTIPGNCMPKAPIMDLMDLHEGANRAYRKLMRTIDRFKELTGYRDPEDADRIRTTDDGMFVKLSDPKSITPIVQSGQTIQQLMLVADLLKQLFSWQSGNLEMLGGLGIQSPTATQDKMLNENSSRVLTDMQDRTVNFTADVLDALCWYWHHDPYGVMTATHKTVASEIIRRVGPERRQQIPYEAMRVKVDPYSLQHSTPQKRMAALNQVVTQVIIPMMPLLQQQGSMFDVNAFLKKIAKYMDMPDLSEIMTISAPPLPETGGSGPGAGANTPRMPTQTQREYTRNNVPMRTERGDSQNLRNALQGVNPGGNPAATNGMKPMAPMR